MKHKNLTYGISGGVILIVVFFFLSPWISHQKNLNDLKGHINNFMTIEHPENTHELYFKSFFGNSTGSSNHCEHGIVQMRKYREQDEKNIKEYYSQKYPSLNILFYTSLESCQGVINIHNSNFSCANYLTQMAQNGYALTEKNIHEIFPVYILENWEQGEHLLDPECH